MIACVLLSLFFWFRFIVYFCDRFFQVSFFSVKAIAQEERFHNDIFNVEWYIKTLS